MSGLTYVKPFSGTITAEDDEDETPEPERVDPLKEIQRKVDIIARLLTAIFIFVAFIAVLLARSLE